MGNTEMNIPQPRYSEDQVIQLGLIPGITNRITLHRKRKAKLIGYFRIGNRVFYGADHIAEFMARCERKAGGAKNAA